MKTRQEQMEEEALAYHESNPDVWENFVWFTFDRINKGYKNYSTKAIFERIRWEMHRSEVNSDSEFKLPNNHTAFYARWFMNTYPEHKGFFRTRTQTSNFKPARFTPPKKVA
jgi:hypothetical protein